MLRLCILAILAITISSCCRPIIVADVRYELMKAPVLVDDDTIVPPPPDNYIGGNEPIQIYMPDLKYPLLAMAKRIESSLILLAYVDNNGFVRRVNVVKCTNPGYGFEESAMAAAYGSKWKPVIVNGNPIGVWVAYKVEFILKK